MDRGSLAEIARSLANLAARRELFNFERFPMPERPEDPVRVYTLNGPGRLPLQALSQRHVPGAAPRAAQTPHMHPTWAAAAGVRGCTIDTLYERSAAPSEEDRLRAVREVRVGPGESIAMMPQDIHSVRLDPAAPCLHLLLYGETFGQAVVFDPASGRSRLHAVQAIAAS